MKYRFTYISFYKLMLFAFLIFNSKPLISQDVHFSQYNGSVINLNPAFTGFFDGDYRVNGIYRSQWRSVPVPYRSFSVAGDARFKTKK